MNYLLTDDLFLSLLQSYCVSPASLLDPFNSLLPVKLVTNEDSFCVLVLTVVLEFDD